MNTAFRKRAVVRFAEYRVDLCLKRLWNQHHLVSIQEKSFELLSLLLEKPGQLVSREELRRGLWPDGENGDLDHNLNVCVTKLRHILSDSQELSRYIQTVPGRGYCFIAPVDIEEENSRIRLAVLSFDAWNTSGHRDFCNGLVAEIRARLGNVYPEQFAVVGQTSLNLYRNTTKTVAQIGRELKIDYIVSASVRAVGKHLHITTELLLVKDETCVWARTFDYTGGESINLQTQVANTVVQVLASKLLSMDAQHE